MKSLPPTPQLDKQIVLVGAGNAHLVFLKRWRMQSRPGVCVLLINESAVIPYSAMVPGFIATEYRREEVDVDLTSFCQSAGARLLVGKVDAFDANRRTLKVAGRPYEFGYDLLSLNLGADAPPPTVASHVSLRPMSQFLDRLPELDRLMTMGKHPKSFVVLGAGPTGCELAVAFSHRYSAQKPDIHVFEKQATLLPQFSSGARKWFLNRFSERGILFHPGTEPRLSSTHVEWDDKKIRADVILLATASHPPSLLRDCGLALCGQGYARVGHSLQSTSHPEVFAVGDCVHFGPRPSIPRNGVYSVRMGQTLYQNVVAILQGRIPVAFHPQRRYLALLNGGSGQGLLARHALAIPGKLMRWLKERIDREWTRSLGAEPLPADSVRCAGCAAKVPATVLQPSLEKAGVVAGSDLAEDCAILEENGDNVTLSTVDFIPAFVDDPYLVGKITALHCLSDLFAMNGTPETALVTLILPWASGRLQREWFEEAMAGVREAGEAHGVKIVGGHTGEGEKFCIGLAVTGRGKRSGLFLKKNLRTGDRLVLTKPLGTGTILAAYMRRMAAASELNGAIAHMLVSNASAARVLGLSGVTAATDVTGFGLVGHLVDMLRASGKSATLAAEKLPLLGGAERLSKLGVRSTLYPDNVAAFPNVAAELTQYPLLFDPQTSGGLLAGISRESWNSFVDASNAANIPYWEIGRVVATPGCQLTLGD